MRWPGDEVPPPSALAGRVVIGQEVEAEKERGRLGKGLLGGFLGSCIRRGRKAQVGSGRVNIRLLGDGERISSMHWRGNFEVEEGMSRHLM